MAFSEQEFTSNNANTRSGVANARRSVRNKSYRSGQNAQSFRQAVPTSETRFEESKSIGAQERKRRFDGGRRPGQGREMRRRELGQGRAISTRDRAGAQHHMRHSAPRATKKAVSLPKINWILVSIASFFSFWIFFFGFWSFALLVTGNIEFFWSITVDDVSAAATAPLRWVGLIEGEITVSAVGLIIWWAAVFTTFIGYISLYAWFRYAEGKKFGDLSELGMFVFLVLIILDLAPGFQMIPWMTIWVVFMGLGMLSSDEAT